MRDFWNLLPASGWERLAADAAWQSTALAAFAPIAARFARRRPAVRAAILLAAAVLSLAVPLLSTVVRATGTGVLAQPIAAQQPKIATTAAPAMSHMPGTGSALPADDPKDASPRRPAAKVANLAATSTTARRRASVRAWPWLAAAWLAASAALALRLLRGLVTVRRWIRSAQPCHDPAILAALSRFGGGLRSSAGRAAKSGV